MERTRAQAKPQRQTPNLASEHQPCECQLGTQIYIVVFPSPFTEHTSALGERCRSCPAVGSSKQLRNHNKFNNWKCHGDVTACLLWGLSVSLVVNIESYSIRDCVYNVTVDTAEADRNVVTLVVTLNYRTVTCQPEAGSGRRVKKSQRINKVIRVSEECLYQSSWQKFQQL